MQPIAIALVTYGQEAKSRVEIEKQLPGRCEDLRTLLTDPKDEYRVDHNATWEHPKTQRSVFYFLSFYILFFNFCVFFMFIYFLFIDLFNISLFLISFTVSIFYYSLHFLFSFLLLQFLHCFILYCIFVFIFSNFYSFYFCKSF